MMSADEISAAKAANLAEVVGRRIKLERRGREFWGCCPFHKEKTPSFHIREGRFYCFGCGARGDVIDWLRATENMDFKDAVREASGAPRDSTPRIIASTSKPSPCTRADPGILAIWQSGRPITGTLAETYLRSRSIDPTDRPSLRFVNTLRHTSGLYFAAMLAGIQPTTGGPPIAVQATFLDERGRKISLKPERQVFGHMCAGAIRFASAGEQLGLAEGSETAMSAQAIFNVPTWASVGAARLDRVGIPDAVRELIIFADNDDAGRAAAERAVPPFSFPVSTSKMRICHPRHAAWRCAKKILAGLPLNDCYGHNTDTCCLRMTSH